MPLKVNAKTLQANINRLVSELPLAINMSLAEGALEGTALAREHTKGALREATQFSYVGPGHYQILSNKFYAKWYEYGNGPPGGRIYPTTAKALCFQMNGETIFAKSVRASGPHPYMTLAHAWLKIHLTQIMKKNILALINKKL